MGDATSRAGAESPSEVVRLRVEFRGRVQGVGFRATSMMVVTKYSISGYVMNLRDGGVLLVAEGPRSIVSAAIQELRQRMGPNIADSTEDWTAATGEFADFRVRYEGR